MTTARVVRRGNAAVGVVAVLAVALIIAFSWSDLESVRKAEQRGLAHHRQRADGTWEFVYENGEPVNLNEPPVRPTSRDEVVATLTPPIIPVMLSISSSGELQVAVQGHLCTPLGTIGAEWKREKIAHLSITLGSETRYYVLGKNKFRAELPNTVEGRTTLEYDGEGNIHILIPSPGHVRFTGS